MKLIEIKDADGNVTESFLVFESDQARDQYFREQMQLALKNYQHHLADLNRQRGRSVLESEYNNRDSNPPIWDSAIKV